jgi:hypothetical protein
VVVFSYQIEQDCVTSDVSRPSLLRCGPAKASSAKRIVDLKSLIASVTDFFIHRGQPRSDHDDVATALAIVIRTVLLLDLSWVGGTTTFHPPEASAESGNNNPSPSLLIGASSADHQPGKLEESPSATLCGGQNYPNRVARCPSSCQQWQQQ